MSKYKNINSSIIYYVLTITLDVSSIGTHTHLLVLLIYYRIIRLLLLTTYSVRYYLNELYSRYVSDPHKNLLVQGQMLVFLCHQNSCYHCNQQLSW